MIMIVIFIILPESQIYSAKRGVSSVKILRRSLLSLSLIVFAAGGRVCQSQQPGQLPARITVHGKVTDTTGALVRGARITAQSTQHRVVVATDQNGEFAISLDPDEYIV